MEPTLGDRFRAAKVSTDTLVSRVIASGSATEKPTDCSLISTPRRRYLSFGI